jgi:hypothetical protein
MRTINILIVLVAATMQSITAQTETGAKTRFGLEISQFTSGSGFQSGSEAHFTVQPSAKAKVGFGLYFDNESKKLSGITITHQRMFMTGRSKAPRVQPYVFYNFIYRKSNIPEVKAANEMSGSPELVTYSSMEHHLGFGLQFHISKLINLQTGVGYGIYLGSIKRPSQPDPITREITGTNGSALLAKMGIGFNL